MGEAVVTKGDVVGHVVNVAARVCEAAKGGQVLATAEVVDAARPAGPGSGSGPRAGSDASTVAPVGVRLGRMKSRRMKGVKTPVRLCEVTAEPMPHA